MDPGWTSYSHRLRYQTFDVTGLLQTGRNAVGAMLGDGSYRAVSATAAAGATSTATAWPCSPNSKSNTKMDQTKSSSPARTGVQPLAQSSPATSRTAKPRHTARAAGLVEAAKFDDQDWQAVRIIDRDMTTLVATDGPPVRRIKTLAPVAITTSPGSRTILDFGQNLVGWLRLTVRGEAGETITLRHTEVLENGELCLRPLRDTQAADRYTLRGGEAETWNPSFTFHGFRYAGVSGWPGELTNVDVCAVVCHSDLERTGSVECSRSLTEPLPRERCCRGLRGNFLDVPTDCPQTRRADGLDRRPTGVRSHRQLSL